MHTAIDYPDFHGLPMGPVQALTDPSRWHEAVFAGQAGDSSAMDALAAAVGLDVRQDRQVRQGFRIGDTRFMIRYEDGSELTELPRLHHLPNSPAWLLGVSNLHGLAVPVMALGEFLDMPATDASRKPKLLVVERGQDATGLVIDGLPARVEWGEDDIADPGMIPRALRSFVHAACLIDDEVWFELDVRALLDELENAMEYA